MKIVAITRTVPFQGTVAEDTITIPVEFRVGQPVVENGPVVSKILHCRKGVAGGEKYDGECYLVKFDGTNEERIIPANKVLDLAVISEGKNKNPEANVELPE